MAANVNIFIVQLLHAIDEKKIRRISKVYLKFSVCVNIGSIQKVVNRKTESRESLQFSRAKIDKYSDIWSMVAKFSSDLDLTCLKIIRILL